MLQSIQLVFLNISISHEFSLSVVFFVRSIFIHLSILIFLKK